LIGSQRYHFNISFYQNFILFNLTNISQLFQKIFFKNPAKGGSVLVKKGLNLAEFRKLEEIVNNVLDNFSEEIERITQAVKDATLNQFDNAVDRLFLAGYVQNIIADYFGDKLVEDVLVISFEEVKEGNLH